MKGNLSIREFQTVSTFRKVHGSDNSFIDSCRANYDGTVNDSLQVLSLQVLCIKHYGLNYETWWSYWKSVHNWELVRKKDKDKGKGKDKDNHKEKEIERETKAKTRPKRVNKRKK